MAHGRIGAHLPESYAAPAGLELGDFAPLDDPATPGWTTTQVDDAGTRTTYEIRLLDDGTATCEVRHPGTPAPLRHPYRKDLGRAGTIADWVDAIALARAAGRRAAHQGPWAEATLDAAVERAAHSIVGFSEAEAAATDLDEITQWITAALAPTQVGVEAAALAWLPAPSDGSFAEATLLRRFEDDDVTGWLPLAATTETAPDRWLADAVRTPNGAEVRPRPMATVRMSGALRTQLFADHALSWSALTAVPGALAAAGHDAAWAVIHLRGTDVALAFPLAHAHVRVRTDDDGSLVTISVRDAALCEAEHRRRAEFERQWGAWLDPGIDLTDDDLERGSTRALALLTASGGNR